LLRQNSSAAASPSTQTTQIEESPLLFYEPDARDKTILPHDPFKALIAPRPIGWVTTKSKSGALNLAPYSYFNAVCDHPPIIMFSSVGRKDSVAFAEETREFVWNMPTYDLRDAMNATSASLPRGTSEFDHAGLETAPSRLVAPPRVAKSPAALECKVIEIRAVLDLDGRPTDNILVFGQVVGVHIDEHFIKNGIVDTAAMQPIARCGYMDYAVVDKLFALARPK
jgi:flavin reductase (DIM6/NTAB) family NADH-FMN oxidoreductase RutF